MRSSCFVERSIGGGAFIDGKAAYCFAFGCAHEMASLGAGVMPAHHRPGVCLAKTKASGRVDVYTRGSQGSVCVTTPIAGRLVWPLDSLGMDTWASC